jgi:hypothetical protein
MYVTAVVSSANGGPLPFNSEQANFYFYYNGYNYYNYGHGYSTNGQSSVTISFTAPLTGHGTYTVQAVILDDHSNIIGDPRAMLNW